MLSNLIGMINTNHCLGYNLKLQYMKMIFKMLRWYIELTLIVNCYKAKLWKSHIS